VETAAHLLADCGSKHCNASRGGYEADQPRLALVVVLDGLPPRLRRGGENGQKDSA
jgi:hypothetical protein